MTHYDRDKASMNRREQYFKVLEKHPGSLILMNVGDFYEAYGDSAKALHDILGITTVGIRVSEDVFDDTLDYAMFPFYNIDSYLPKLIHAGKKVGICEPLPEIHITPKPEVKLKPVKITKEGLERLKHEYDSE